ncbi:MAG: hypothetical protein LR015_10035 [Verrucomicrobia bacterium]|nr:hypothetical protein [Verrucomicrobiota bacterium]
MSLAAFHTLFIALGVAAFLPFTARFAALIERIIPETGPALTKHLDSGLRHTPSVALEASQRVIRDIALGTVDLIKGSLQAAPSTEAIERKQQLWQALHEVENFFQAIPVIVQDEPLSKRRIDQLHALDHLSRLQGGMQPPQKLLELIKTGDLPGAAQKSMRILDLVTKCLESTTPNKQQLIELEQLSAQLADWRRSARPKILEQTARGDYDPQQGLAVLDIMRWLDRFCYHSWRISHYLHSSLTED